MGSSATVMSDQRQQIVNILEDIKIEQDVNEIELDEIA
jgi:hypothetical protein